jgi:hypothetical protein
MSPKLINQRIAEACGWKQRKHCMGYYREGHEGWIEKLPDYYGDLNACHEMEEHLHGEDWATYFGILQSEGMATGVRATAPQRCEAFLRTLGLWEETK